MPTNFEQQYRPILEAISFAARAHKGQMRKDGETPYASHVFRVCFVLRHVFGIDDTQVLTAAALHDTLEDTTTDFDDLEEKFDKEVAGWVAALSKDKRLGWGEREAVYDRTLAGSPWQVQVCKLADIFDNLMDARNLPPEKRGRSFQNATRYLQALQSTLRAQARKPYDMVAGLLKELKGKT